MGDRMTRTMNVKKMNIVIPMKIVSIYATREWRKKGCAQSLAPGSDLRCWTANAQKDRLGAVGVVARFAGFAEVTGGGGPLSGRSCGAAVVGAGAESTMSSGI